MRLGNLLLIACTVVAVAGCGSASAPSPSESVPSVGPSATTREASPTPTAVTPSIVAATATPQAAVSLVEIGDSIPFGQGDCGGCESFPHLFGDWVAQSTGLMVEAQNLSRHDGYTAARMAVDLPGSPLTATLAAADIIVVTIGHNDTPWNASDDACDGDTEPTDAPAVWRAYTGPCVETEVARFRHNMDTILTVIAGLRAGMPTALRLTTQYNDVLAVPTAPAIAKTVSIRVKDAFNEAACQVAEEHGFVCVDVYHAFNGPNGDQNPGDLISSSDYTHPTAKGHQLIAQLLEQAGIAPLSY